MHFAYLDYSTCDLQLSGYILYVLRVPGRPMTYRYSMTCVMLLCTYTWILLHRYGIVLCHMNHRMLHTLTYN